jgi:catechol 2,3-dioxygenase-like lactoylglutathione lyase family enzyme
MGMFTGVSHIYYAVRDLEESLDFYVGKLGFHLLRRYSTAPGRESAYVELGGVLLELGTGRTPEQSADGSPLLKIGIAVSNIDSALSDLQSKGVEVAREPWDARTFWGRQAVIRDPNGYGISLREWDKGDGPYFEGWQPLHEDVKRTG